MQHIGKLDKEKLGKYKESVLTEDVIITEERKKHIEEHHPNNYKNYSKYILEILKTPDYILEDNKNIDTVIYLKTITEENRNIQIVVRLATNQKEENKKNSIITLWKIKDKNYKKILKNKKIIWKK